MAFAFPPAPAALRGLATWGSLALALSLAVFPILILFVHGVSIFAIANEFVAYRMGDALNLMFGDGAYVRPVQGLPTALLSKAITYALYAAHGSALIELQNLQIYAEAFFATGYAIIGAFLLRSWPAMTWAQRGGVALLAVVPWSISPTACLLVTPDYWFGEYAFLICSLALLAYAWRQGQSDTWRALWIGAWVGAGLTIKITMVGIAPMFFLALPQRTWRSAGLFAAGTLLAYAAIIFVYAGLKPVLAWNMLAFQLGFFVHPNDSLSYPDFAAAIEANPRLPLVLGAALLLAIASVRKRWLALSAIVWITLLTYLIARRPHDTSIASAMLCGLFMIAYLGAQLPKFGAAIPAAMAFLLLTPTTLFPTRLWRPASTEAPVPFAGDILFLPDNYWNAALPIQAWGYNGQLALRPVSADPEGRPVMSAPAFKALFGPTVLLGASAYELGLVEAGLRKGMSVAWTRPPDTGPGVKPHVLFETLRRAGAAIHEEKVLHRGGTWYFGRAKVPSEGRPMRAPSG